MIGGAVGCGPKVVASPAQATAMIAAVPQRDRPETPKAAKFLPIRALRATSSPTTSNQRADDRGSGRLWAEGRGEPGAGDRDDRGRAAARSAGNPKSGKVLANTGSESYIKPDDQQPA